MSTKAQHERDYQRVPPQLRDMRERAGLTQRALGAKLGKPQSWVYNCETANRRVDVTEFIRWAQACDMPPVTAFKKLLVLLAR